MSYIEDVLDVTRLIPKGRVTTYGAIADFLTLGSARMVGWALRNADTHDVPAHRVVNRKGELSGRNMFSTPFIMQEKLEAEKINIKENKIINFDAVFWHPSETLKQ